jgi:hypothetical protein
MQLHPLSRLWESANIAKHGGALDPERKRYYSTKEIIAQTYTDVPPEPRLAEMSVYYGKAPDEPNDGVVVANEPPMRSIGFSTRGSRG